MSNTKEYARVAGDYAHPVVTRFCSGMAGLPFELINIGGVQCIVSFYLNRGHGQYHPLLLRHVRVFGGEPNGNPPINEFISLFGGFSGAQQMVSKIFGHN